MKTHYFAGGNTETGFVGFYDKLTDRSVIKHFITIKGGSGVGKSTVMKKVCELFENDCDVELFHCTGDISSLDGVSIPKLGIVLVDGTAPHVTEPLFVRCSDENFDLSECVETEKVMPHRDELKNLFEKKKFYYDLAYSYIKSAGSAFNSIKESYLMTTNFNTLESIKKSIIKIVDAELEVSNTYSRKLFDGAITAEGEYYFDNSLNSPIIYLDGDKKFASIILGELYNFYTAQRTIVETFFAPISANSIYSLNINGINITTNEKLKTSSTKLIINICDAIKANSFILNEISNLTKVYDMMVANASEMLKKAKECHEQIEKIYVPSVNFETVNKKTELLLQKLSK